MLKIDLNPRLQSGLFNQLYSLVNGIIIAKDIKYNLYVKYFYPQYNLYNKVDINEVINIKELEKINNIKIFYNINININWLKLENYVFHENPNSIVNKVEKLKNYKTEFIDINDSFGLFYLYNRIKNKTFLNILFTIPFTEKFTNIKNNIINQINNNYISIHLRIEDDINERERNASINKYIENELNKIDKNEYIYFSTGLTPKDKYYYRIDEIKKLFPNALFIKKYFNEYEEREYNAIIDYLVCRESYKFYGCLISTFSITIANYFNFNNKLLITFNVY